jgi:hypothetical protein
MPRAVFSTLSVALALSCRGAARKARAGLAPGLVLLLVLEALALEARCATCAAFRAWFRAVFAAGIVGGSLCHHAPKPRARVVTREQGRG